MDLVNVPNSAWDFNTLLLLLVTVWKWFRTNFLATRFFLWLSVIDLLLLLLTASKWFSRNSFRTKFPFSTPPSVSSFKVKISGNRKQASRVRILILLKLMNGRVEWFDLVFQFLARFGNKCMHPNKFQTRQKSASEIHVALRIFPPTIIHFHPLYSLSSTFWAI